jgi:hypothetical protein
MVGTLAVSPGRLPADGGYFYAIHDGALARFRTAWVRNLHDYLPGLPVCRDDPDSADAIRPYLPTRDPESVAGGEQGPHGSAARRSPRGGVSPTAATASTKPASTAPPRWAAAGGATFGTPPWSAPPSPNSPTTAPAAPGRRAAGRVRGAPRPARTDPRRTPVRTAAVEDEGARRSHRAAPVGGVHRPHPTPRTPRARPLTRRRPRPLHRRPRND